MGKEYILSYIFAVLAVIALITAFAFVVMLIYTKKEKRPKKSKIAAGISALCVPLMTFLTVASYPHIEHYNVRKLPDLTGCSYEECKIYYSSSFELVVEKEEYSSEYPEGTIISHFPGAGAEYEIDSGRVTVVKCVLSGGKAPDAAE